VEVRRGTVRTLDQCHSDQHPGHLTRGAEQTILGREAGALSGEKESKPFSTSGTVLRMKRLLDRTAQEPVGREIE
jgi:hypothetical protein